MNMTQNRPWIFLDAMGVIYVVGDDTNDLLVPYVQQKNSQNSREYINEVYMDASLGKITSDKFWEKMNIQGFQTSDLCEEYLDSCLVIDKDFIEVARKLKKNYNIAMLSNDVSEWSLFLRNKFGLEEVIDAFIISGDVGVRKPDEKIYQIALDKVNATARDSVFIDDRKKNLRPAKNLGMHIIRFARECDDNPCLDDVCEVKSFDELQNRIDEAFKK